MSAPLTLPALSWHRLSAALANTRVAPTTREPLVVALQKIVSQVSERAGLPVREKSRGEPPHVVWHVRNRPAGAPRKAGERLHLEVMLCRGDGATAARWSEAFAALFGEPDPRRNFDLDGEPELAVRRYEDLAADVGPLPERGEVCLDFLSPVPFRPAVASRREFLDSAGFLALLQKRVQRLLGWLAAPATGGFRVLPYYWRFYDTLRHDSKSQPGEQEWLRGCIGRLYLKGDLTAIAPLLLLGSELHAGDKLPYSLGYYRLHPQSTPHFAPFFPNRKALAAAAAKVVKRYDDAAEVVAEIGTEKFDPDALASDLEQRLREGTYEPAPYVAFRIEKSGGRGTRQVEKVRFFDLVVQHYVLQTVGRVFDRMFEESSIGFRKGLSRADAIQRVRAALGEGFRYVVESDIEEFFPSVDLDRLWAVVDGCLPERDTALRRVLQRTLRAPYVLDGRLRERTRGLAQGSPLSPVLANLYLDVFDEFLNRPEVRSVRYGDDFVILVRTREKAEQVLAESEEFLSGWGLRLKKEKTAIHPAEEGFRFLGIRFERSEVVLEPEEELRRLKKPLYILEPHLFLALNGDAVDVKRAREVVATVPLRRLSEVIVLGHAVFSAALLSRCATSGVPVTFSTGRGYHLTTVTPDSKRHHEIAWRHASRYYSLSETERLSIAKEFSARKLVGYATLFRQKYVKGSSETIHHLEQTVRRIHAAGTVDEVRGHEGAAAKTVYRRLNALIESEAFHIKKRDRDLRDPINSLLNFAYYLLFCHVNATLRALGLNPYLGFLHSKDDRYESFADDVEELFRARVDRFVIRLLNLRMITKADFLPRDRDTYLKTDAARRFIDAFEGELARKSKGLSLQDAIYLQGIAFRRWAVEDTPLWFYEWAS